MNGAIQAYGVDRVIDFYHNNDVAPWAVWCGNQFMFHYSGSEMQEGSANLRGICEMILDANKEGGASPQATYTLAVYDDLPKGGKINNKTPYSGCFNFKLVSREMAVDRYSDGGGSGLRDEVRSLKAAVEMLVAKQNEDDSEVEPGKSGVMGMLSGLLDMPEVQRAIAGKVVSIIDHIIPSKGQGAQLGQVAGALPGATVQDELDLQTRLQNALGALFEYDPLLVQDLEKLAVVAKGDPAQFNLLLSMLRKM